ncbi:hypothetical protein [Micromonospora sp. CA-246542]|uniref:hypothetical protein n=1 Tax=Micromonospora sp. CA-246542 TaxID=3239959 RepID=UPI003D89BFFB
MVHTWPVVDEELVSARRPRDVVDAAGAWIGDALAADGFGWLRAVVEASEPSPIVTSRAGDYSLPFTVMEWLASRDRVDLVCDYAERYLARNPGIEQRFRSGNSAAVGGQPVPPINDLAVVAGWPRAMLTTNPGSAA